MKAVKGQIDTINKQLNNCNLDGELSIEFGDNFLYSKLYLRFLEKEQVKYLIMLATIKAVIFLTPWNVIRGFQIRKLLKKFLRAGEKVTTIPFYLCWKTLHKGL